MKMKNENEKRGAGMAKKETVTQEDLFEVLDMIEQLGIRYWLDGGWGVDALVGVSWCRTEKWY